MPPEETATPEAPATSASSSGEPMQPALESPSPAIETPAPAIEPVVPPEAPPTPAEASPAPDSTSLPQAETAPASASPSSKTSDERGEATAGTQPTTPTGPQGPLPFSTTDDRQENQVAQIPPNEPIPPEPEPIASTPAPVVTQPEPQPAASVPVILAPVHAVRDLLNKARVSIQDRKRKKRDKIMEAFTKKNQITNDEVEKLLHVSDATATRYLSALEKEGKIIQVGKKGKGVLYIKTP